jgi:excisionase family DNA binding protein
MRDTATKRRAHAYRPAPFRESDASNLRAPERAWACPSVLDHRKGLSWPACNPRRTVSRSPEVLTGTLETLVEMVADRVAEKLRPMLAAPALSAAPAALASKSEVASALRVSPASIDRLVRAGRIPFVRVGDVRRFDLESVRAALAEQRSAAAAKPQPQGPLSGVRLLSGARGKRAAE